MNQKQIFEEITRIIFLHTGSHDSPEATEAIVSFLEENNLKFGKYDEAFLLDSARQIMDKDGIL
jgi:hypothetical protein